MRQIGAQFQTPPDTNYTTAPVEAPVMTALTRKQLEQWQQNTFLRYSYNFCSEVSGIATGSTITDENKIKFNTCLTKFGQTV